MQYPTPQQHVIQLDSNKHVLQQQRSNTMSLLDEAYIICLQARKTQSITQQV